MNKLTPEQQKTVALVRDAYDRMRAGRLINMRDLAKKLGFNEDSPLVSMYLGGYEPISLSVFLRLASILGIPEQPHLSELFGVKARKSNSPVREGNHIFISYSRRDFEYLHRLQVHLAPLKRMGVVTAWDDTNIVAGEKWKKNITEELDQARAAILLISADFLASNFIIDAELPTLLRKAEIEGTRIFPVILKPCRFERDSILREFQSVNSPGDPVSGMNETKKEQTYDTVSMLVERLFDSN